MCCTDNRVVPPLVLGRDVTADQYLEGVMFFLFAYYTQLINKNILFY